MSIYRNIVWFSKGISRNNCVLKIKTLFIFYLKTIGMMEYTRGGYESALKHFNQADLDVDLANKAIMVTGANSGIGKITALEGKILKLNSSQQNSIKFLMLV